MYLDLTLVILNVDKSIDIEHDTRQLLELEKRYGLTNISRIYQFENMPTKKLRANDKSYKSTLV